MSRTECEKYIFEMLSANENEFINKFRKLDEDEKRIIENLIGEYTAYNKREKIEFSGEDNN